MEQDDEYYKVKSSFLLMSASESKIRGACYKIKYTSIWKLLSPLTAGGFIQGSHLEYQFQQNTS